MNGSPSIESEILKAAQFATDKHRDQRRKGKENSPYINHPIAVAEILTSVGGVTDLTPIQAALRHDTVEDTNTTPDELAERFGGKVMRLENG
jgi:guanosine-3',5'-bis(diphosphate) 3'-pyrophosphohydrolase